jgi:NADH-quinone oxidoreductase subunit E
MLMDLQKQGKPLSEEAKARIREQMARYPSPRSALGHALYIAQAENGGWVPFSAVKEIAGIMGLEAADVQSMMSFYVLYNKEPVGKFLVEICHNISCAVMGAPALFDVVRRKCGIGIGETTEDGLFTLKGVECLAACGGAPCLQINGLYHENVTPEQLERMIDQLRTEGGPSRELYDSVYAPEKTPRLPDAGKVE